MLMPVRHLTAKCTPAEGRGIILYLVVAYDAALHAIRFRDFGNPIMVKAMIRLVRI